MVDYRLMLEEVMNITGLPRDIGTLRAAARFLRECCLNGVDVTAQDVAARIEETYRQNTAGREVQFLGRELIEKMEKLLVGCQCPVEQVPEVDTPS